MKVIEIVLKVSYEMKLNVPLMHLKVRSVCLLPGR